MRPLPDPSPLSLPFWSAAREHELIRPYCTDCEMSFFVPQEACPRCLSEQWEWRRSSGRGRIYSYTVCHRAPLAELETPYAIAIVDLEEEWQMMSNLVDCDLDRIEIGQEVEVSWLELTAETTLPVFKPRTSTSERP